MGIPRISGRELVENLSRVQKAARAAVLANLPTVRDDFTCDWSQMRGRMRDFRADKSKPNPMDEALWAMNRGAATVLDRSNSAFESQCLKWRMPVKTMAMPSLSAAAITSWSLTEPPG